jgi:hypothetical protein
METETHEEMRRWQPLERQGAIFFVLLLLLVLVIGFVAIGGWTFIEAVGGGSDPIRSF